MKIITPGQDPKEEQQVFKTCFNCEAEFIYDKRADTQMDRDGRYVVCPCCKQYLSV